MRCRWAAHRDAGYIRFGDPITVHGLDPSLDLDLAELYYP